MKKILVLFVVMLLSACGSMSIIFGDRIKTLNIGESKEHVVEILGKPDSFEQKKNEYIFVYLDKMISGWGYQYTNYYLFFNNKNQLIAIKTGDITDRTSNVTNAINQLNNNLQRQDYLNQMKSQQIIDNINKNRPQKVIICKSGDYMCF